MKQTLIEKIIANHGNQKTVKPGDIVDVFIDTAQRDFGGANVVKNIADNGLKVADPSKTVFTFDCNPTVQIEVCGQPALLPLVCPRQQY